MKKVVISVGGSAINPGKINVRFLKELKRVVLNFSKKHKVVLVAGGGFIARHYISALKDKNEYVKDLIGLEATILNAKLLASFIGKCNQEIPTHLEEARDLLKSFNIVIASGFQPGSTSDGSAAVIADYLDVDLFINYTNVKGLYTKNPKIKGAKFVPKILHEDFYKKYISKFKEKPGQHFILDSLAAKVCRNANIKIAILTGIKNLENCLKGKKFIGTFVS
ncbi:UMP kinase [archaeon]|nr:UMP kinase [archaeon]